ncbi:Hypothetical protein AJAP_27855 [Amycolatopsis japonica]|uniref:Uncharacterized protein n=1 Tax=Amycolatopsis japonica TaxID=208439 RepID=A0A075V169_9PSEU|nr:Hypothetical protein AJAP_27855 [Amycolatopsis japonica]
MASMTAPKMRTVCHRCRPMSNHRTEDEDGVIQVHQIPDTGDGRLYRELPFPARGVVLIQSSECPDCHGTGWLDGFVTPG